MLTTAGNYTLVFVNEAQSVIIGLICIESVVFDFWLIDIFTM